MPVFIHILISVSASFILALLWSLFHKFQFSERDSSIPSVDELANRKWHSFAFKLRSFTYIFALLIVVAKLDWYFILYSALLFTVILDPLIAKISLKQPFWYLGSGKWDTRLKRILPLKVIFWIRVSLVILSTISIGFIH